MTRITDVSFIWRDDTSGGSAWKSECTRTSLFWNSVHWTCEVSHFTSPVYRIHWIQDNMTVQSERDYLGERNVCWRINWSQNLLDQFYSIIERTTYVNITEGEVSGGDLSQCWGIIQCSLNICILTLIQYSSVLIAQEVTGSNHNAQRGLGGGAEGAQEQILPQNPLTGQYGPATRWSPVVRTQKLDCREEITITWLKRSCFFKNQYSHANMNILSVKGRGHNPLSSFWAKTLYVPKFLWIQHEISAAWASWYLPVSLVRTVT